MKSTSRGVVAVGGSDRGAAIARTQRGTQWSSMDVAPDDVAEPPRPNPFVQFDSIAEIGGVLTIGGAGAPEIVPGKPMLEPRIWTFEARP